MKSLLLIDTSHIYWSAWHATKDLHADEAFEITVGKVHQLRNGYNYVACCVDTPPYWRKELSSTYKLNREAAPPQAIDLFERVKERLTKDGILLWGAKGFEADDVAAWARAAAFRHKNIQVTLATADKDWMQLVDDDYGARLLSTRTGKFLGKLEVIEALGVAPEQVVDFLALVGDKGDNVAGIPGVGPVKAAKLLMQYGSLDEVLANADKQTPALRDALIEHAEAARLARKLVTLRTDVPLDFSEIFKERNPMPLTNEAEYDEETGEVAGNIAEDFISPPKPDSEPFQPKPAPKSEPPPAANAEPLPPVTTALAVREEWTQRLEPQNGNDAYSLAKVLYNSRLYTKFPNHQAIFAVILRGREMGISALAALDCFHVIDGKPAPYAHLIIARAQAHPHCEYFAYVGGDDTYAEYTTKHRHNPKPTTLRYTIKQAEEAGRLKPNRNGGPSQWMKIPAELLRKTCGVQLTRIVYPDAALGLYAVEELADV